MHFFDKENQIKLIRKYKQSGDQNALDLIIRSNEKLVISMARKIKSSNAEVELDDLIQEGFIGMLDAIRKFDTDKGANFSTFATYSIRNRIGKFLMANKSILKFSTSNDGRTLFQKHPVISRKLDNEGLTEEQKCQRIAEELNVGVESVRSFRQNIGRGNLSLDARYGSEDSEQSLMGTVTSEDDVELSAVDEDFCGKILTIVGEMKRDEMSELEKMILDNRYLGDEVLTLSAIGKMSGYSVQHIANIERKLLQKIKSRVTSSLNIQ